MKTIHLTQGYVAFVDDEDYAAVSAFNWCIKKTGRRLYAFRKSRKFEGTPRTIFLHGFLLPTEKDVDHKDGDGLNCQRDNLRAVTRTQNLQGFQRKRKNSSSTFRGVIWRPDIAKWRATITLQGKQISVGCFDDETQAAKARDKKARLLGFPPEGMNFP